MYIWRCLGRCGRRECGSIGVDRPANNVHNEATSENESQKKKKKKKKEKEKRR